MIETKEDMWKQFLRVVKDMVNPDLFVCVFYRDLVKKWENDPQIQESAMNLLIRYRPYVADDIQNKGTMARSINATWNKNQPLSPSIDINKANGDSKKKGKKEQVMKTLKMIGLYFVALLRHRQERQKRLSIAEMLTSYDLTGKTICLKNVREKGEDLVGLVNFICIISEMLIIQVKQGYFWHPGWAFDGEGPEREYIEDIRVFNYDPDSLAVIVEEDLGQLEIFREEDKEDNGSYLGEAPIVISL